MSTAGTLAVSDEQGSDRLITGLVLAHIEGRFVVQGTIPWSPASRLGLREGDIISEIDGRRADHLTWMKGMRLLRKQDVKPVNLLVERAGERFSFSITRESERDILARSGLKTSGDHFVPQVESAQLAVGDQAPPIEGVDLLTNELIEASAFRGSEISVVFWASWCGACQEEIERLRVLQGAGHGPKLIIGVSLDETPEATRSYVRERRFADYLLQEPGWFGPMARAYRVYETGIPWEITIGADGRILWLGRHFSGV